MKRLVLMTLALLAVVPAWALRTGAQSIPPINAKALDNSQVVLPKTGSSQLLVLVLGFSHKSGDNCTPWGKRLASEYHSDARVEHYQVPVLAGAPSFVRPMIVKGMRKGVPTGEQPRFVPVYDHEAEWKKLVNFSAPDDPYIILSHPDGTVVWQAHGVLSEALYSELKSAIAKAETDAGKK
jgi:hypothetical protein